MNIANSPLHMINTICPCCDHNEFTDYAHGYDYEYRTSPDRFTFVRCDACSVLFLNPRPALSELNRIYPKEYEPYHFDNKNLTLCIRSWLEARKARFLTRGMKAGARILDAGCGGVAFLNSLNKIAAGKWELWGNDIDADVCGKISAAGYAVAHGRLEELSLPDGFFDMIILKQVIEHLDKPSAVIDKAFLLLKSEGELVIETPNSYSWDARLFRSGVWGGFHFPRHWTIFDSKNLPNLGKEAGFEVKSIEFMLSPVFWVQSVHHLLQSYGFPAWITNLFNIRNPFFLALACMFDLLQKLLIGTTSNMRIVFYVPTR